MLLTAITISSNLSKDIPLLEGSNYLLWADTMKSFLRSQGVWQTAKGRQPQLVISNAMATSAAEVKEAMDEVFAWNNKDNMANGYMVMRISPSLHHIIAQKNYSKDIWDTLATTFGVQGPALIYVEFKSALTVRIPAVNPAVDINRMATIFG